MDRVAQCMVAIRRDATRRNEEKMDRAAQISSGDWVKVGPKKSHYGKSMNDNKERGCRKKEADRSSRKKEQKRLLSCLVVGIGFETRRTGFVGSKGNLTGPGAVVTSFG